jgi:hypothetical protein
VKLWDHWKIQIIYQGTDENGAAAAKRLEETVLWEARFLALQQADGERSPVYQTPPYCVRIAVSGGAENSSQLTLSVVAVVAFGPDGEEAADDLVGGVLKRLGLLRLTESVRN